MNRENITVAIIDDEEIIRRSLSSWLEDFDYDIILAESGVDALQDEACINADIAIVDMRMEGLNGNQTIIALHERNSSMKYILHTGSNDYTLPNELRKIGITEDYVFHKPVLNLELFCETIDQLMGI